MSLNPGQWTTWWPVVEQICAGTDFSLQAVDNMLTSNVPYRQFIDDSLNSDSLPVHRRYGTRWRYRLRVPVEEVREYLRAEDARRRLAP